MVKFGYQKLSGECPGQEGGVLVSPQPLADQVLENYHNTLPLNYHHSGMTYMPPNNTSFTDNFVVFSFSEDTLKILASDIERQNGIIPCK